MGDDARHAEVGDQAEQGVCLLEAELLGEPEVVDGVGDGLGVGVFLGKAAAEVDDRISGRTSRASGQLV